MKFQIDDKVKIPKTKTSGAPYAAFLREISNDKYTKDYLIVKQVSGNGRCWVDYPTNNNPDFLVNGEFTEADLEHYEEIKTEYKTTKNMKLEDVALTGFTRNQLAIIRHIIDMKGGDSNAVGDNYFGNYSHVIHSDNNHICSMTSYKPNSKTIVSFGQFVELLEAYKAPKKPIHFYNGVFFENYGVEINENGIEVGCQKLSFENFDILVKTVADFRNA